MSYNKNKKKENQTLKYFQIKKAKQQVITPLKKIKKYFKYFIISL